MRITELRSIQPESPGSPPDWRTAFGQILVAIDTDMGLTGLGVGGGGAAGVHVVRTVLRDLLLDADPENVEELWARMYTTTLPYGRKGLAIMAISGVDLALWDLRGKAAGRPVAELLGGRAGQPVPTYITLFHENVGAALEAGFDMFKIHFDGLDASAKAGEIARRVGGVRQAIGPDRGLMVDAFMRWNVDSTLEVSELLRPHDVTWLEEPLPADDLEGYAVLRDRCAIPIAGGEHEYTARGFAPLIDSRLHRVLQPDVCWCGGMTELVKIYEHARRAGLRVCPHRGAEPWGLHAIAALDPEPLAESGRSWMTWLHGQPEIVRGMVTPTDAPGFGVEVDEALLSPR